MEKESIKYYADMVSSKINELIYSDKEIQQNISDINASTHRIDKKIREIIESQFKGVESKLYSVTEFKRIDSVRDCLSCYAERELNSYIERAITEKALKKVMSWDESEVLETLGIEKQPKETNNVA